MLLYGPVYEDQQNNILEMQEKTSGYFSTWRTKSIVSISHKNFHACLKVLRELKKKSQTTQIIHVVLDVALLGNATKGTATTK